MQKCPDPLEAIRSIGYNQPWYVALPNDYSYILNNVNDDNRTNIIDSSLCANSKLVQRLQHKINTYQTPTSNDTRQILQHLTNIIKQHVPSFVFNDTPSGNVQESMSQINQQYIPHHALSTSNSINKESRTPSLPQHVDKKTILDKHRLSKKSSHDSRLPNSTSYSTNLSTQNLQFSTKVDKNKLGRIISRSMISSRSSDSNDPASIMKSNRVLSKSSAQHLPNEQVDHSQLRQAVSSLITASNHSDDSEITRSNTIDLKNSTFLSPLHSQQSVKRISTATSTSNYEEQDWSIPSGQSHPASQFQDTSTTFNDDVHQNRTHNDRIIRNTKNKKRNRWIDKLTKKLSSNRLNSTSYHDTSLPNFCHMYIDNQPNIDLNRIHMREAMGDLELDLTKEVFQALINQKNDCQQNGFMRLLTAPSRCCRSCRTQRRLATIAQHSIDIAIKKYTNS